jgi:hypothetical protein
MIRLLLTFALILLGFRLFAQRTTPNRPSPNQNRPTTKPCTEEVEVWQEARWERIDGVDYWSPAQWVHKKIEFDCQKRPISPKKNNEQPIYSVERCAEPTLDPVSLQNVLEMMRKTSFEATRITTAKQVIQNNCLLTPQVKDILRTLSFEQSRLEIAKFAYDFTVDQRNFYSINDVFQFESTISQLDEFLKSKPTRQEATDFRLGGKSSCPRPMMDAGAFRQLSNQIRNATSDITRLAIAKQGIQSFCISSEQVRDLAKELTQEINRLELTKESYRYTYDPQNYIVVHEVLQNNNSKQELSRYIRSQQ